MVFNSFEFVFFFALLFPLYAVLGHRFRNPLLLVASYVFYAAWDWRFCSLLALSTLIDFSIGRLLHASGDPDARRRLVALSLFTNLGVLGFFKYAGFFSESLQALLASVDVSLPTLALEIVLPVGISFYTFQTLSYTLDIYRGRLRPTHSLIDFAVFVAFFPQLVAGPIERASRLLPQIQRERRITAAALSSGGWLVFWGFYKKVVIADNLAVMVDSVYRAGAQPTAAEVLFAVYGFTWQIYCDFSGYTDIARGIARMLGVELMVNFRIPFAAPNPQDFWRRWHISLSTWLRDYLYFSLGGGRSAPARVQWNLLITMLLGGLWHGAAWTYVIWGAYHGVGLVLHRRFGPRFAGLLPHLPGRASFSLGLRVFVMFHFWCGGMLIFRAVDLAQVAEFGGILLRGPFELGMTPQWLLPFAALLLPLVIIQAAQLRSDDLEIVLRWPMPVRVLLYVALGLNLIVIGDALGEAFIYFQF